MHSPKSDPPPPDAVDALPDTEAPPKPPVPLRVTLTVAAILVYAGVVLPLAVTHPGWALVLGVFFPALVALNTMTAARRRYPLLQLRPAWEARLRRYALLPGFGWYQLGRRRAGYRFLCPRCLQFGRFLHWNHPRRERATVPTADNGLVIFAPEAAPVPGTVRRKTVACARCRPRGPEPEDGYRYACRCEHCGYGWRLPLLHERQVEVVGVLAAPGWDLPPSERRRLAMRTDAALCFDDGERLIWVLDLLRYSEAVAAAPGHAAASLTRVWIAPLDDGLELARRLDRLERLRGGALGPVTAFTGPGRWNDHGRALVHGRFRRVKEGKQLTDLLSEPVL